MNHRRSTPIRFEASVVALCSAMIVWAGCSLATASAQSADDLRRIWNDPAAMDRTREQQERARTAAEQAAAQQRAAAEAAQRQVAALPEDERKRIQGSLATLEFYGGPIDGNLASPESVKAVGEWQKARNRPQTGRLTPPEVKVLAEEAAAKSGIKERLDSDSGIAGRRADAEKIIPAQMVAPLFDGARDDVIVFIDGTPAAPNIVRGPPGPPTFRDRKAQICAQFGWHTTGDMADFVRSEIARHGAERLVPDLARACPEPRPPLDLLLLERRHLFEQAQEKIRPLLNDLRDGKLSVLTVVDQSDLAAFRARRAEEAKRAEAEKQRAEAARKAADEQRREEAAKAAEEERRSKEAARRAADDPLQKRKAVEPRAKIMSDALLERLRAYMAGNGVLDEGMEEFRRWYETRKAEGRTIGDMRAVVDDFGSGTLQGRSLEAIAVEIYFDLESRDGPQTDCMVFAWLEESPIRRSAGAFSCDRVAHLESWKARNGFRSRWR